MSLSSESTACLSMEHISRGSCSNPYTLFCFTSMPNDVFCIHRILSAAQIPRDGFCIHARFILPRTGFMAASLQASDFIGSSIVSQLQPPVLGSVVTVDCPQVFRAFPTSSLWRRLYHGVLTLPVCLYCAMQFQSRSVCLFCAMRYQPQLVCPSLLWNSVLSFW